MESWKLKTISEAYTTTKDFRFNNYVVTPHIISLMGEVKGKSLLEVGCGFGRYLEIFSKHKPLRLGGCDISLHQVELCKQNLPNTNVELYNLDFADTANSLVLGHNIYDIVYNVFVILYLESLEELERFIENCYKCLNQSGRVIICTLDILSATAVPEIFNVLNFPVSPLKDNKFDDGYPIQIKITDDCILTSYQRNFNTLKLIMEKVGFKEVRKHNLFLNDIALQAFSEEEFDIIKKSNILLLIEAKK